MAISPELQRASQQMLQADIALITNVRLDHTDVMGATREEICASLLHMAPEKGLLITGEEDMLPFMQAVMKKNRAVQSWHCPMLPDTQVFLISGKYCTGAGCL